MSKKTNELKNALQSLKVNEALRLSKGVTSKDFAFRPPEPSQLKPNLDQNNLSSASSEISTTPAPSDLRTKQSQIESPTDQKRLSSNKSPIESSSARRDQEAVSPEINKSREHVERRSVRPEISSSLDTGTGGFDVTPFLGVNQKIELVERGEGTFHIPHKIYELVHKAVDTKVELLVFNCLLRYTLGFQRSSCQASQSFISRWTGIAVPNVRKALKSLIEREFIRRLEEGTIVHESAVYELPIVTAYLAYERCRKLGASFTKSEIEKRLDENDLRSKWVESSDQNKPRTEIDSIPKKERGNKNVNKTRSLEMPDVLANYFAEAMPKQKLEREQKAYLELENQFGAVSIARAFEFLKRHGALEDKKPVHSPMAYLAFSIGDVLRCANAEDEAIKQRQESERRQTSEQEARRRQEEQEAEESRRREKAFCTAFPNVEVQEEFIKKTCGREQFSWKPQGKIARTLAIQTWWDELSVEERRSLGAI